MLQDKQKLYSFKIMHQELQFCIKYGSCYTLQVATLNVLSLSQNISIF